MIEIKYNHKEVWFAGVYIVERCIFCLCDTAWYTDHNSRKVYVCPFCSKQHNSSEISKIIKENNESNRYLKVNRWVREYKNEQ